jgi:hypothetical protein
MMRDVIDRFRYRFQLWRREQRDDYLGAPRTGPQEERDYVSHFSKHPELVTESTFVSIGRRVAFFGIISIGAYVCFWVVRLFPTLRFAVGVVFVVFVCLWTLCGIFFEIDLYKARKQYREGEAKKSSNQALQLTADRREDPVSIHEPPYTPSFPQFRQR